MEAITALPRYRQATMQAITAAMITMMWARPGATNMKRCLQICYTEPKVHPRLRQAGLLEGIYRYYGAYEYLVYADIPQAAIVNDFSVDYFKQWISAGFYRMQLIAPDIIFQGRSKPSAKKLDLSKMPLDRHRSEVVLEQLCDFVLADFNNEPVLRDILKRNIRIDWELGSRWSLSV
ncbi:hypothetical protein ABW21_db0203114 [Orbilia brochopaga]|nr:hypothetical protein ABW21_db0203114 [Drechslerella brochopaga]